MPAWFSELWGYPRIPAFNRLMHAVQNNRLPKVSIVCGPAGTAKNTIAYILGMVTSCPNWDRRTHRPCGTCPACRDVVMNKRSWIRGGLVEVDGASKDSDNAATDMVNDAFKHVQRYSKQIYSGTGDPAWDWIVFIDEAHRLPLGTRESLLTLLPRFFRAHLILATTDLKRLSIEKEGDTLRDPLLSRGTVFRLEHPTIEEAAAGLVGSARRVGLRISEGAARSVATRNQGIPRGCLGDLYELSGYGNHIDDDIVQHAFECAPCTPATPPVSAQVRPPDDEFTPY